MTFVQTMVRTLRSDDTFALSLNVCNTCRAGPQARFSSRRLNTKPDTLRWGGVSGWEEGVREGRMSFFSQLNFKFQPSAS